MNKFVLANILKNFRWLKIRLHDILNNLNCPRCYSLSLRYSIYKVQSRSRLTAEARLSYHSSFHLSRTFFKFFQISLSGFDSVVCHLAATRASYHSSLHLSSTFFVFFHISFRFPFSAPNPLIHTLSDASPDPLLVTSGFAHPRDAVFCLCLFLSSVFFS